MIRLTILALLVCCFLNVAQAQTTITVNTLDDDTDTNGNCTFREALYAADADRAYDACPAGNGADVIDFSVTGTIHLQVSSNWPSLSNSVTITGPGPDQLIIDATDAELGDHILDMYGQSGEEVFTISGLTVKGARGEGAGGVSVQNAMLHLSNAAVIGNEYTNGSGSGVYISGAEAMLEDVRIAENVGSLGGGMTIWGGGQVTAKRLTVELNRAHANGGGIFVSGANTRLVLIESTIADNQADSNGGGLLVRQSGAAELANVTISSNQSANNAGGLAVWENSMMHLHNVTVTGNTAGGAGGGFDVFRSQPEVRNTIIAGNTDSGTAPDVQGTVVSFGYNLIGNSKGASGVVHNESGDQVGTADAPLDPMLDSLADNGGPTRTHALLDGSPAYNTANPEGCLGPDGQPLTTDQRGVARVQGSQCDMGAFEVVEAATAVDEHDSLPNGFVLHGNYPNPFNPATTIRYAVPQAEQVRLTVYDLLGREVAVLVDRRMAAGEHAVVFEAAGLPSGMYLYRLEAGAFSQTRRLVLIK